MPAPVRPTYRARRHRADGRRARTARPDKPRIPWLVFAVLGVLAIAALGSWWSTSGSDNASQVVAPDTTIDAQPTTVSEALATTEPEESEEKITHITFGSHAQAKQPCVTCHPDNPTPGAIVCRDCHDNVCGKDAKTVADCLECHQTGTTAEWSP